MLIYKIRHIPSGSFLNNKYYDKESTAKSAIKNSPLTRSGPGNGYYKFLDLNKLKDYEVVEFELVEKRIIPL